MNNSEKKNTLLELIDKLCSKDFSKDWSAINEWIQKLNEIYSDGYRHDYADLFYKLQEIFLQDLEQDSEACEILGENLNVLEQHIEKEGNNPNIAKSYKKFADHIRLEIGRYTFVKVRFEKKHMESKTAQASQIDIQQIEERISKVEEDMNEVRPTVTHAQKELDNLDSKLENNKVSSITTIAIFSAVALTFSGSIAFESGILQGMHTVSACRLICAIALTGFILFNTIFVLLYLVGRLVGKPISKGCKRIKPEDNSISSHDNKHYIHPYSQESIRCKLTHQYAYITVTNIALLWIMYAAYISWLCQPINLNLQSLICLLLLPGIFLYLVYSINCILERKQKERIILSARLKLVTLLLKKTSRKSIRAPHIPFLIIYWAI